MRSPQGSRFSSGGTAGSAVFAIQSERSVSADRLALRTSEGASGVVHG